MVPGSGLAALLAVGVVAGLDSPTGGAAPTVGTDTGVSDVAGTSEVAGAWEAGVSEAAGLGTGAAMGGVSTADGGVGSGTAGVAAGSGAEAVGLGSGEALADAATMPLSHVSPGSSTVSEAQGSPGCNEAATAGAPVRATPVRAVASSSPS